VSAKPSTPQNRPDQEGTIPLAAGRERFTQRELDEVLGHYELGEVRSVRELPLGTPTSPKAVIECARGTMLLKRRARGVDAPERVAFSHELMLACLRAGVCVPPLVGTRGQNNSMVQLDDRVYELFVFIKGQADPRTADSAAMAGSLLGEIHTAMDAVKNTPAGVRWPAPAEAGTLDPDRADRHPAVDPEIRAPVRAILDRAAERAARMGVKAHSLVHGDWHPGNLVFWGDVPVAVCDFDHARLGSRTRELAQGLTQFSLRRGQPGEPLERWSAEADLDRLAAHWRGYAAGQADGVDPAAAIGLMPGVLMDEALAASDPDPRMVWTVLRKAQWLEDRAAEIAGRLGEGV
jgi:Ser/Thr protein kinase RdoA (MazF antagonist)